MTMIFVNLPVRDAQAAGDFWAQLDFHSNPQFSGERSSNAVIGDNVVLILLEHSLFAELNTDADGPPAPGTSAVFALSVDSRAAVDALADRALTAGGSGWRAAQDQGFMYERAFTDPDGHRWQVMWVDLAGISAAHQAPDSATAGATA